MSSSAVFQVYRDEADVQFPKLDLLLDIHAMGTFAFFTCKDYSDTVIGTAEQIFNLLAIRAPTRGTLDIEHGPPDPQSFPLRHEQFCIQFWPFS